MDGHCAQPAHLRFRWFWLLLVFKAYVAGALFMLALSVIELLACLDEGLALERRGLGLLVGLGLLAFWLAILRHALPAWASGRRWIRRGASLQAK